MSDSNVIDISNGLEPVPILVAKDVMSSSPKSFPRDFQYVVSNVTPCSRGGAASPSLRPSMNKTNEKHKTGRALVGCSCPPGQSCDPMTCRCCRNVDGLPIYRNRLLQRGICSEVFPCNDDMDENEDEDGTDTGTKEGGFFLECGPACACSSDCVNRQSQRGVEVHLSLRVVACRAGGDVGVGVFTDTELAEGKLVCTYSGEVLRAEEAAERLIRIDTEGESNYILVTREHGFGTGVRIVDDDGGGCNKEGTMDVLDVAAARGYGGGGSGGGEEEEEVEEKEDESCGVSKTKPWVRVRAIDPTRRGNVGRWLNHACDGGNLSPWMVRSAGDEDEDGSDVEGCRVVFFTTRVVHAGEELRWKYGENDGGKLKKTRKKGEDVQEEELPTGVKEREGGMRKRCFCSTSACRGWMPFDDAALLLEGPDAPRGHEENGKSS